MIKLVLFLSVLSLAQARRWTPVEKRILEDFYGSPSEPEATQGNQGIQGNQGVGKSWESPVITPDNWQTLKHIPQPMRVKPLNVHVGNFCDSENCLTNVMVYGAGALDLR
ncbi:uncharacterized protein LOC112053540 [Bicyclus anynana]|uniref:Uncharacterized protein LOC112053540 n=1 Tax=Bicyclus anynana TaxID=110368 RepID=A0ABM3M3N4_BICAN|nr:uncharacterized protein LOC112053540 [Bicyclus anynana]